MSTPSLNILNLMETLPSVNTTLGTLESLDITSEQHTCKYTVQSTYDPLFPLSVFIKFKY